ncbi:hypothetical protein [Vibrio furnissii]|uniref:hypothetical protein n=1 Tax=Vibrio TaxID=662 RepID=UPI001EEA301A|nr:hypothetical protein [Vibrio furnissii]
MNKIKTLSLFFTFAVVAMTIGAFVNKLDISGEYKTVTAYVIACAVAYVFYVISGESKRDDADKWEDE